MTEPGHAVSPNQGKCANVRITTTDGRVFNLGAPDSPFFTLRRWIYKFRRRNELKGTHNG